MILSNSRRPATLSFGTVHLPTSLLTSFSQRADEALSILIIPEDRLAAVAAVHEVIDRSRMLHPQLPCHARSLLPRIAIVNTQPIAVRLPVPSSESTIVRDPFAFARTAGVRDE
jgi:hypothetical protein